MDPGRLDGAGVLATTRKEQIHVSGRLVRLCGQVSSGRRRLFLVLRPRRRHVEGSGQVAFAAGSGERPSVPSSGGGGGGAGRERRGRSRKAQGVFGARAGTPTQRCAGGGVEGTRSGCPRPL